MPEIIAINDNIDVVRPFSNVVLLVRQACSSRLVFLDLWATEDLLSSAQQETFHPFHSCSIDVQ